MRRSPVRMTLYCRRVIRLVVRSALNTPANFSLTDLRGEAGALVEAGSALAVSEGVMNTVDLVGQVGPPDQAPSACIIQSRASSYSRAVVERCKMWKSPAAQAAGHIFRDEGKCTAGYFLVLSVLVQDAASPPPECGQVTAAHCTRDLKVGCEWLPHAWRTELHTLRDLSKQQPHLHSGQTAASSMCVRVCVRATSSMCACVARVQSALTGTQDAVSDARLSWCNWQVD